MVCKLPQLLLLDVVKMLVPLLLTVQDDSQHVLQQVAHLHQRHYRKLVLCAHAFLQTTGADKTVISC
jgi:hypothetical protein